MGAIIYKIELTKEEAIIIKMTSKGDILSSIEASPSYAKSFAIRNGLCCMEDNGEVQCYW